MRDLRDPALAASLAILSGLDDPTMTALYQNAAFCCYPSAYEGYGLPIVEAFHFARRCSPRMVARCRRWWERSRRVSILPTRKRGTGRCAELREHARARSCSSCPWCRPGPDQLVGPRRGLRRHRRPHHHREPSPWWDASARTPPDYKHSHETDWIFLIMLLYVAVTGILQHGLPPAGHPYAANILYLSTTSWAWCRCSCWKCPSASGPTCATAQQYAASRYG